MTKNALEMINDIDENLIVNALEEPKKGRNTVPFGKLKWTALAACLAVVMAVPVFAEIFGFTLMFDENDKIWNADTNARFAFEEYSEEVQNVKGQEYFTMQNMEEAEKFLGIDMPDNAVLKTAEPKFVDTEYLSNGNKQETHCDVFVGENEGNLLGAYTEAYYYLGEEPERNLVNVNYFTVCEQNPYENGGGFGYGVEYAFTDGESVIYTSSSGREWAVVSFESEYDYEEMGVAEVNRVLVAVRVYGLDKESVHASITAILDAYE